jgi:predicted extracellular nuclease
LWSVQMKIDFSLLSVAPRSVLVSLLRTTGTVILVFLFPGMLLAGGAATNPEHPTRVRRNSLPFPSVAITALGTPITENFDSLAAAGTTVTWTDNTTLSGWHSQFQSNGANPTTYTVDTGNNPAGGIYSEGIEGTHPVSDRALGSISSNTTGTIYNALKLSNATGSTIGSLAISYTGEQWRNGGNSATQALSFQYQVANAGTITDANTPSSGWISFGTLDFVSPVTGTTAVALDGNAAANRTAKAATLTVTVAAGQEIWLRWVDANDTGADHGLAIDDLSVTANAGSGIVSIHTIQGSGITSPLVGQGLTTSGIVTALRSNGFFLQTPDANADSDTNTSEGIFVFTASAPPGSAAIGNFVNVSGTVAEFIPAADPTGPPLTEITGPGISVQSTGNPLPAPIALMAADTLVNNISNLEKYEGMRVFVSSLTVVAPTEGTVTESSATSVSNGVCYGVITGVARPFTEPGISVTDPVPPPAPANVPRFDANPERLRIDSDGQQGSVALDLTTGAVLSNLVGVLDYSFKSYTILPDTAAPPTVSGNTLTAIPAPAPAATQLTVASFNLERFFDTNDDPNIADPVLTATAFNNRLKKASLVIRSLLRTPDVVGVEEVENLSTLQSVANKINADAVAAAQPNPNYQPYLVEGNDVGGIDVGFLVKATRVTVIDVTQFGLSTTYINPNTGQPELLNDRPPLVLRATVPDAASQPFGFTVIVNHLRSLNGIADATDGNRIRTKRRAQAEYLANLVQARQVANPNERLVVLGDFNAFQFNDGYVDVIGTIKGTPTPSDQVVLASPDLVNPDLTDLVETLPPAERYSFTFDGNAGVLDHVLVGSNLLSGVAQFAYARFDADFPESFRNDSNRPERISDHDASVTYISLVPTPTQIVSRKVHGSAGPFDINLPLSGPAGIECRAGQGANANNHQVVVSFAAPVTISSAAVTSGVGNVSGTSTSGNEITINLTAVGNAQTINITLFDVNDAGNIVIPMSILLGDTTGSGSVNSTDVSQTKGQSGSAAILSNFRTDITASGAINSSDVSTVKLHSGTALPAN